MIGLRQRVPHDADRHRWLLWAAIVVSVCCGYSQSLDNGLGRTAPAMGWSSWNHFRCSINDTLVRQTADALVSSGLRDVGFKYVNIDDCWQALERDARTGALVPDPRKFPYGMAALAEYVHSKGLKLGIYTSRGQYTCQGRPGSAGHETLDAQTFARWGVDYLKDDSCKSTAADFDNPEVSWAQYSTMRDALNRSGRPIWFSITGRVAYNDSAFAGRATMHCIRPPRPKGYPNEYGAFTVRPWVSQGKDVLALANSYLVEYCNNQPFFGTTAGRGGFLSQLDSQQLLTWDNMTSPGAYNDNDMLECCNPNLHGRSLTSAESRAQFATFAIQSSPLILGNDLRSVSDGCLEVIGNHEIIALATNSRAKLVYQWPDAAWPDSSAIPGQMPSAQRRNSSINILHQIWAKQMPDGSVGVIAFNRGSDTVVAFPIYWQTIGLNPRTVARVRDLWAKTNNGTHTGSFRCQYLQSHDVCALRIFPL